MRPAPLSAVLRLALALVALAAGPAAAQLTTLGALPIDQNSAALGVTEADDDFGAALAVGDFDADGFPDLAVGVPGQVVSDLSDAGAIHILYGYAGGVSLTRNHLYTLASGSVPGVSQNGGRFGGALAAGDFDGDGYDDLAVGAPGYDLPGQIPTDVDVDAGAVWVFWGASTGLTAAESVQITQDSVADLFFPEGSEQDDRCGWALAATASAGSAKEWLWIGCPGEDLYVGSGDHGLVMVLRTNDGSRVWDVHNYFDQDSTNFPGAAEDNDELGYALAAGDFDGDGREDVAIGIHFEDVGDVTSCGAVAVIYGDPTGFDEDDIDGWDQESTGVQGQCNVADHFGERLAVGDFDADGFDDLAIGIPQDEVGDIDNAGSVSILFGSAARLTSRDQLWNQGSGLIGAVEAGDEFGGALAAGDFDGDGAADLAVGAPFEDIDTGGTTYTDGGAINVLYGLDASGLTATGNQLFHQDSPSGMPDAVENSDRFGQALVAADFDGNGFDDLAIGTPLENLLLGQTNEGLVTILYSLDPGTGAFGAADFVSGGLTVSESVGAVQIEVERTGGAPVFASIEVFAGMSGSATSGVDFTGLPATASWNVGEIGVDTVTIQIVNDTLDEANETRYLELRNPSAGLDEPGAANVLLTILDDDVGGEISFLNRFNSRSEPLGGSASVSVRRLGGAASGVTVNYATSNLTAIAGVDYTAVSGTLNFAAGDPLEAISVPVVNDGVAEGCEYVKLTLSAPGGGATLGVPAETILALYDAPNLLFCDGFELGGTATWTDAQP